MKNILLSLGFLAALIALCFTTTSMVSAETNDDFLNVDLNEGETVVDFYIETSDELDDSFVDSDEDTEFSTSERSLKWYAVSESYEGHSYGNWKYAGASTLSGGVLTASHTTAVSNTYSGSLEATKSAVSSEVGFDITYTDDKTVSYSTHSYPDGEYRLEYRHVYKKYKVKQELKSAHPRAKVYDTKYVYPKKWVERQYRVVEL
ncbi:hypothetical protein [Alteribacillus sp. HJP-4]|uniref:hypothetical protein n=1 Tax=Alteribacillus sp. HJP-4 TaxID=2775394 RepID=UPI0035CD031C